MKRTRGICRSIVRIGELELSWAHLQRPKSPSSRDVRQVSYTSPNFITRASFMLARGVCTYLGKSYHFGRVQACVAVLVAISTLGMEGAQQPTPSAVQIPVFRTRTDLVELDVSVLDGDRRPVRGLTKADFTVFEDGKPEEISIFEAIDVPDPVSPPVEWMRSVTPDVATNETKITRLWVIAIDDALIPTDPWIIKSSKKIVEDIVEKFGPEDLATIVFTANSKTAQDFTNDRTKLLATLDKYNPGFATWAGGARNDVPPIDGDIQFMLGSVNTLLSVMDTLVALPHTRKGLIWVTPGVPMDFEVTGPIKAPNSQEAGGKIMGGQDAHLRLMGLTKHLFEVARRANVPIYPIDPCGLFGLAAYITRGNGTVGPPPPKAVRSMDHMMMTAANTGGHAIVNTNDFTAGITSIFEENKSYYQIGYTPTNTKTDGTLRRIQVKVNRPGVDVRTKFEYVAPKRADSLPKTTNGTLARAVANAVPVTDLPLRATVAPFAIPGGRNAAVAIALGVRQPVPESAASGRVTVATELQTSAFTTAGDHKGTQRHTAKVVVRAGAQGDAEYEALSRIDLAPGRYRLRIAAIHEAAAKTGTVMVDVIVPDFNNDAASISGVVLAATPGHPSAPRDLLRGIVPVIPTAQRVFTKADSVSAYFDLYQAGKNALAPARLTIRVVDGRGTGLIAESRTIAVDKFVSAQAALDQLPGVITGGSATARSSSLQAPRPERPDQFANAALRAAEVLYQIPLDRLQAGRYLLTFEAAIGAIVVRRDVQFEVR